MPDIDVDFDSPRRDEVIAYIYRRLGHDHVAMVATVNTMTAGCAVRIAARAFGRLREVNAFSRYLPWVSARKIPEVLKTYPECRDHPLPDTRYADRRDCRAVRPHTDALRHASRRFHHHARADGEVDAAPVGGQRYGGLPVRQRRHRGAWAREDGHPGAPDALGDLAGGRAGARPGGRGRRARAVRALPGRPARLQQIASADTVGMFQLESSGQRNLSTRLKSSRFEDIIAQISLFRAGPLEAEMITPFIRRRHGLEEVTVPHEGMREVLADWYGVIVYQEQVLLVARAVAGFGLARQILRRAMTKGRSREEMERIRGHFLERALARGVESEVANEVFGSSKGSRPTASTRHTRRASRWSPTRAHGCARTIRPSSRPRSSTTSPWGSTAETGGQRRAPSRHRDTRAARQRE